MGRGDGMEIGMGLKEEYNFVELVEDLPLPLATGAMFAFELVFEDGFIDVVFLIPMAALVVLVGLTIVLVIRYDLRSSLIHSNFLIPRSPSSILYSPPLRRRT